LSCHDFDSLEQNEKGLDVVVGIDMLLVMMFHPPQGVTMIEMMPTYFNTEHHGKKMRRISALQLLEPGPKTHVRGKIMSVSRLIDRHVKFPLCVMGDTIKVEGWHCVPCCPDVVYEQPGKSTWIVDLYTMQLLLNLRFSGVKTDGCLAPINSFTQIKDPRSVYSDTDGKLLLRVEGTQQLDKGVVSSQKIDGTTTYECEVCYKFQGDAKATRQHMAGYDLQSADDWFGRYKVLKLEFLCMLCGIRNSHGVNPGKDPNTMDWCFMWFETNKSQPTHYCKLVQETKPYGSWVSANKCRWKSANWKDSKPPKPSSNVAVRCPGCFMMTPTILLSISMYPHEGDYVKCLFENPGKALTSKCLKNDKNTHDCECAL